MLQIVLSEEGITFIKCLLRSTIQIYPSYVRIVYEQFTNKYIEKQTTKKYVSIYIDLLIIIKFYIFSDAKLKSIFVFFYIFLSLK